MQNAVLKQNADPDKIRRREVLVQLITEQAFGNQLEVAEALNQRGFGVTQSSVSRDFRDLGIMKLKGRYVLLERSESGGDAESIRALIRHVDTAGPNLVVVKTRTGAANVVALTLDFSQVSGIVGTVAGDDTIFVATRDRAAQQRVLTFLQEGE